MKKSKEKSFSEGFFTFVEKGFDWIALIVIALIILFALVFLNGY
ncbi:hypothetical protein [Spirosoma litoris]